MPLRTFLAPFWAVCLRTVGILACQPRSEEHTSELQSQSNLVCRLLLEKKKITNRNSLCCPMTYSILIQTRRLIILLALSTKLPHPPDYTFFRLTNTTVHVRYPVDIPP